MLNADSTMPSPQPLPIDLDFLARQAAEKQEEHEAFRSYLKARDGATVDGWVMAINAEVEPRIDCTACGQCCRQLMINIEDEAVTRLAQRLQLTEQAFRDRYVQTGATMQLMNTVPCHFLENSCCSVYTSRPRECREFPQLHRPQFTQRLFSTLMHYGMCPIIYHVVEKLKVVSGFQPAG